MEKFLRDLRVLSRMQADSEYVDVHRKLAELQGSIFKMLAARCDTTLATIREPLPLDWRDNPVLTLDEQQHARRAGGKIPAIKLVRDRMHLGFKDAKEYVEAWMYKFLGKAYIEG